MLAARNIPAFYAWLQNAGYTQRLIAALVGHSQSEVSEILKGRQVLSYDVLARICDGMGIPRGWMGLVYDASARAELARDDSPEPVEEDDVDVKRRNFVAATEMILFGGTPVLGQPGPVREPPPMLAPLPKVVTHRDVGALRALTRRLRALGRAGTAACLTSWG